AFIALDKDWRFRYVNPSYMKLVGRLYSSPGELLGKHPWEKFPDLANGEITRFYERAMAEQRPGLIEVFYEPLGAWLEVHAYPSPDMLSVYIRDITERRETQEKLRKRSE